MADVNRPSYDLRTIPPPDNLEIVTIRTSRCFGLSTGRPRRYQIALGFFDSAESYGQDVAGWFHEYLFRAPSAAEQAHYVAQMEAGATDRMIEQEITNLPEYADNSPTPADGAASALPDYYQTPASNTSSQAAVAAKDAVFSRL